MFEMLKVEQEITTFARVRARGVSPVVDKSVGHIDLSHTIAILD